MCSWPASAVSTTGARGDAGGGPYREPHGNSRLTPQASTVYRQLGRPPHGDYSGATSESSAVTLVKNAVADALVAVVTSGASGWVENPSAILRGVLINPFTLSVANSQLRYRA
jgi:hypothetical protein